MWLHHWFEHFIGMDNPAGPEYGFWSGFGSDLGEVTIIAGLVAVYRRHNCEQHGCWRIGRHSTAAGHMVCRKHHPDGPLTSHHILAAHKAAKERQQV